MQKLRNHRVAVDGGKVGLVLANDRAAEPSWRHARGRPVELVLLGVESMIGWAATFLIIALIAAVLGFSGVAGVATNIAWILFVVGLILALVFALAGRRRPPI